MALYAINLTLPMWPGGKQSGSVLTGRLESALAAEVGGPVVDGHLAAQVLRGSRVSRTRWALTVRAADPAKALMLAVDALRQAMGADARSWDVAAMEATVRPAAASRRAAPLAPAVFLARDPVGVFLQPAGGRGGRGTVPAWRK